MSAIIAVFMIPLVIAVAVGVFILLYPEGSHYDFCEGDYCYVCVSESDIPAGFEPDRRTSYDAGCGVMEYAVRYDR